MTILALGIFSASNLEAQSLLQQAQKQSTTSKKSTATTSSKKQTAIQGQATSSSKKNIARKATVAAKKKKGNTSKSSYNNIQVIEEPEIDDGFDAVAFAYNLYQIRDFSKIKQSIEAQTEFTFTKQEENETSIKYVRNSDAQEALIMRRASKDTPYCNYIDLETRISSSYDAQQKFASFGFMTGNPNTYTGNEGATEISFQHKDGTMKAIYWTSSDGSEHSILMLPSVPFTWPAYFQFISSLVKLNDVGQICERLNSYCWYPKENSANLWEDRKKVEYMSPNGSTSITIKRKNKKSMVLNEIEIRMDQHKADDIASWFSQAGYTITDKRLNVKGLLGGTYDIRKYNFYNGTKVEFNSQRDALLSGGGVQNFIYFKSN